MSWSSLAFLLTSAMFLVPFGRLADIHGRKKIYLAGTLVFTVASILLGLYPSAQVIIWLRALQGFGTAMIFGTGVAILVSVTPPSEKGATLGINAAAVYVGLSIGPYLGGLLTQTLGWRSILFTTGLIGFISLAVTTLKLKGDWSEAKGESFDMKGSAVYAVSLLAIMYGFSLLPAMSSVIPLLLGAASAAVFFWVESRVEHPILNVKLFQENHAFAFSNLAALINFSATFAVTFLLSVYLQYIRGLTPQDAGTVMIASPIVQAVLSPVIGRLSDRVEPSKLSSVGMAATGVAIGSLALLNESSPIIQVVGSLILLGAGLSLFSSPNTNAVMSSVDRRFLGIASSTLGTMRLVGQMVSMGITMIILALTIGRVEITPAVYHQLQGGIQTMFTVSAVLCVIGILPSIRSGNRRTENA
jgi:MFS family permease